MIATKYFKLLLLVLMIYIINPLAIKASTINKSVGNVTSLPIPRFVSTKSKPTNVRTGPGRRYPIKFTFSEKVPLKIIDEYQDWRKIEDWQGEQGWIHKALLSSRRLGLIENKTSLYKTTKPSGLKARLGERIIVKIDSCDLKWCYVEVLNVDAEGYIDKRHIWGINQEEIID
ncbi:MAG: SH3 domain-containing protein [Alphaproteobacteria bacterium]|jgi:SH3-like domain-containing protein